MPTNQIAKKQCEWCDKPTRKRVAIRVVGKLFYVCKKCEEAKVKERGFSFVGGSSLFGRCLKIKEVDELPNQRPLFHTYLLTAAVRSFFVHKFERGKKALIWIVSVFKHICRR